MIGESELAKLLASPLLSESRSGVSESFPQRTVVSIAQDNIDTNPPPSNKQVIG